MTRNWEDELSVFSEDVEKMWMYLKGKSEFFHETVYIYHSANRITWKRRDNWSKPINESHRDLIHKNTDCRKNIMQMCCRNIRKQET